MTTSRHESPIGDLNGRATLVVSINTAMAWDLPHRPTERYQYPNERRDPNHLIVLFDGHYIPPTLAIARRLMLGSCKPVGGARHPESIRPDFDWLANNRFDGDPLGAARRDPKWCAPALIELSREAAVGHEVAIDGLPGSMVGEASLQPYNLRIRPSSRCCRHARLRIYSSLHQTLPQRLWPRRTPPELRHHRRLPSETTEPQNEDVQHSRGRTALQRKAGRTSTVPMAQSPSHYPRGTESVNRTLTR